MPDEAMLRKRIQELQQYRRMGLTTAADIDKFDLDSIRRVRIRSPHHEVRFSSSFPSAASIKGKFVAGLLCF